MNLCIHSVFTTYWGQIKGVKCSEMVLQISCEPLLGGHHAIPGHLSLKFKVSLQDLVWVQLGVELDKIFVQIFVRVPN